MSFRLRPKFPDKLRAALLNIGRSDSQRDLVGNLKIAVIHYQPCQLGCPCSSYSIHFNSALDKYYTYTVQSSLINTWSGESSDPDVIFPDGKVIEFVGVFPVEWVVNKVTRVATHQSFGVGGKEFFERTLKGLWNDAELNWKFTFFLSLILRHGDSEWGDGCCRKRCRVVSWSPISTHQSSPPSDKR